MEILNLKLKLQHLTATDAAKHVAIEVLSRARNRPNFGNAGEVENLLSQAKGRFQTRQKLLPVKQRSFEPGFEPQDFDPDFNRREHASTNLDKLFEDIVGSEAIIEKLRGYQNVAHRMKLRGKDARDQIPMNFVFKGPPGRLLTLVCYWMDNIVAKLFSWINSRDRKDHSSAENGTSILRHGSSVVHRGSRMFRKRSCWAVHWTHWPQDQKALRKSTRKGPFRG